MIHPAAVIFDMDGVLIDSEPAWQAAEIRVLGSLGVPLDASSVELTTGWRIDRVVEYWREQHPFAGSTRAIAAAITEAVAAEVRARGTALPGALELLSLCRASDLRVGLATSSDFILIEAVLERLGIAGRFEAIASASEVLKGKPDPSVYLLCADRLAVGPDHCVAIEDSQTGIRSAVAAGMSCVAVHEPRTTPQSAIDAGAQLWVSSLKELTPDSLRALVQPSL
jgi:HAD superfamily hydrolase (TIGR01509 family)